MDQSDCEVDQKLAADFKCEIVQHLKDKSIRQLQKDCEAYDQRIREAWETIQTQMASFNQRKDVIFSTLRSTLRGIGDEEPTREAIWPGLDEIVPPTYRAMTDAMRGRDKSRGVLPTPVTSPSTSNALSLNLRTPDTAAGVVNATSAYDVPSSPTPSSDPAERRAAEPAPRKITPPKALFVSAVVAAQVEPFMVTVALTCFARRNVPAPQAIVIHDRRRNQRLQVRLPLSRLIMATSNGGKWRASSISSSILRLDLGGLSCGANWGLTPPRPISSPYTHSRRRGHTSITIIARLVRVTTQPGRTN
jgi:hypothetical protein